MYQNILVESRFPEWSVKIADFGISKRAQDGDTDFRTHIGTSVYMAPEVLDLLPDRNPSAAYSVAVDIWAIGIITVELLLKRLPFSSPGDIVRYCYGSEPINLDGVNDVNLSHTCRDFVGKLLSSNPNGRPIAGAAKNHRWVDAELRLVEERESLIDAEESFVYQLSMSFGSFTLHLIGCLLRMSPVMSRWLHGTPRPQLRCLGQLQQLLKH